MGEIGVELGSTQAGRKRRHAMGERRASAIERILQRIEEHVEDWRRRDAALQAEADESRSQLWAEAAERERLLAEAVGAEEERHDSIEDLTKDNRVVFVLHREELIETLEDFARQGDRLVGLVPRKGGETISQGLKGSWLVFERSEQEPRAL
jgi:hypothetical protein